MKSRILQVSACVLLLAGSAGQTIHGSSARTILVTSSAAAGPGTFAAAIELANADPKVRRIQFVRIARVQLQASPLFTGPQDLTIEGRGAALDAAQASGPALRVTGGGDLTINDLTILNSTSEGLTLDVPHFATGTIRVRLSGLEVLDNDGHGVLVDDQDDASTPELDGDSAASLDVHIVNSLFARNGYSVSDRDGLRINEGGDGDLRISLFSVRADENGADGIEADERGAGDVHVEMFGSQVTANGRFDPADLDDGFDIDENDDGSIVGRVWLSSANDNYEEGFDFNENHAGDLRVDMLLVEASRNGEEGIDYEEDDDFAGGGDLVTSMTLIRTDGNRGGDAGLKIREKGDGNLEAAVRGVHASDNLGGASGINIREDAGGSLEALVSHATATRNANHGIDFDENRINAADLTGALTAVVASSVSSENAGTGVRGDSQTPAASSLTLRQTILTGNAAGETGGNVTPLILP